jgi:hypothetical protein
MIPIVQAIPTDQSRIAMSIIHALSSELTLRLDTSGMADAREARIVALAAVSDELFESAFADIRIAVPLRGWADTNFVGTACHV